MARFTVKLDKDGTLVITGNTVGVTTDPSDIINENFFNNEYSLLREMKEANISYYEYNNSARIKLKTPEHYQALYDFLKEMDDLKVELDNVTVYEADSGPDSKKSLLSKIKETKEMVSSPISATFDNTNRSLNVTSSVSGVPGQALTNYFPTNEITANPNGTSASVAIKNTNAVKAAMNFINANIQRLTNAIPLIAQLAQFSLSFTSRIQPSFVQKETSVDLNKFSMSCDSKGNFSVSGGKDYPDIGSILSAFSVDGVTGKSGKVKIDGTNINGVVNFVKEMKNKIEPEELTTLVTNLKVQVNNPEVTSTYGIGDGKPLLDELDAMLSSTSSNKLKL